MRKFITVLIASMFIAVSCVHQQTTTPTLSNNSITAVQPSLQGPPAPLYNSDAGLPEIPDVNLNLSNAGQNGERITALHTGQSAPYNGVLFNGPAVAYIQVEFRGQAQQCLIDRNHDLQLAIARYNADIATLQLALDTQRRMDQVVVDSRDHDIAALNSIIHQQQQASGPNVPTILIAGGAGLLIGAVAVGIFVVALRP